MKAAQKQAPSSPAVPRAPESQVPREQFPTFDICETGLGLADPKLRSLTHPLHGRSGHLGSEWALRLHWVWQQSLKAVCQFLLQRLAGRLWEDEDVYGFPG